MENREVHQKMNIVRYLKVHDNVKKQCMGLLLNVSPEALTLLSDEPISQRNRYFLKVALPDAYESSLSIVLKAQSQPSRASGSPPIYITEFLLSELDQRQYDTIQWLQDIYCTNFEDEIYMYSENNI